MTELKEKIQAWIQLCGDLRNLSENSLRGYRQDLSNFLTFITVYDVKELSQTVVCSYLRYLREEKSYRPATVRRRIVTLRKFLSWSAEQFGHDDPFTGLELDLAIPKRLPRPVDRPTLKLLFRHSHPIRIAAINPVPSDGLSSFSKKQITGLALRVLVSTGLRIGELTHLRLNDISGAGSRIRVIGKGDRERTVYITNPSLLDDLWHYCQHRLSETSPNDWLFLNTRNKRLTEAAFRVRLRSTSKSLNLTEHLTPHRFRHSAATLLIEEGVDIRIVQRLLGHASIATTELYTQVSDNSLIAAIEKADTLGKVDQM